MAEVHSFGQLPVIAHAWNKDRTQIAVSLGKNDIRIYEKQANNKWKWIHTLCEHLSRVLAIDWAPNSNRIITSSADYNAYVWTLVNGVWKQEMVELQRTNRAVCCAKWSPEENKFAVGTSDKNVAVCYWEDQQRFWAAEIPKKRPRSTVTALAWHPNNQLLAVGSLDYRCRIYSAYVQGIDSQPHGSSWGNVTNCVDLLHEFSSEAGWVHDVNFSPMGENLTWVAHNSTLSVVSSKNLSQVVVEQTKFLPFRCVIFVDQTTLIVGGHEFVPMIYRFDERKGTIELVGKLDDQEAPSTPLSPGKIFSLTTMNQQTPELVSIHQNMITQFVPYQSGRGNLLKISSADLFGQVVIWDLTKKLK